MLSGVVLYEGPSNIDGSPIVVIATTRSDNRKTGALIQTWILSAQQAPHIAAKEGSDTGICGACPLRKTLSGGCYVVLQQAPLSVFRKWTRGRYPAYNHRSKTHRSLFQGRELRLGAYGDPAAVPRRAWSPVLSLVSSSVGYTHQWARSPEYADILMASVHSPLEAECAQQHGWRTYRIRSADQPLLPSEVVCPASAEGRSRLTCRQCMGCNGSNGPTDKRRSFAIIAHGRSAKKAATTVH